MELKPFQREALDLLREYFEEGKIVGPEAAFATLAPKGNPGLPPLAYRAPAGLDAIPYVCLRLPTGAGKTFLAAAAIGIAAKHGMNRDYPVVLWLVPTKTIRDQTADALKDPSHAYRKRLDEQFGIGRVKVFDLAEYANIRPQDLSESACVIVATIQGFRVTDKEGRKIYAHSEAFESHFRNVPPNRPGLQPHDKGGPRYSFANVLHLANPLVLVDEAHNARTELSYDALKAVNPAAIVELSATPKMGKGGSNVLYRVSADAVRDAELIKLPIVLGERRRDWQATIHDAVACRDRLDESATKGESDYIRPIALYQAQDKSGEVTVEVLKAHLIEHEQVEASSIAIATGTKNELDQYRILDADCPIRHVITIEALREGWDCPFAYVFCSVAEVRSKTAVEQLLGRVLRMPYARRRQVPALNRAYAFVNSERFGEAATRLVDQLVEVMGFEGGEAAEAIAVNPDPGGMFSERPEDHGPRPVTTRFELSEEPDLSQVPEEQRKGIAVSRDTSGAVVVTLTGAVPPEAKERLIAAADPETRATVTAELDRHAKAFARSQSPAERGERIVAPKFQLWLLGDEADADDPDQRGLLVHGRWRLNDESAELAREDFHVEAQGHNYQIDFDGRQLSVKHLTETTPFEFSPAQSNWDAAGLSRWLDGQVRDEHIGQGDRLDYCLRAVSFLLEKRGLSLDHLLRFKFQLAEAMRRKIAKLKAAAVARTLQTELLPGATGLHLTFDPALAFAFDRERGYAARSHYSGRYLFAKSFFGKVGELEPKGEEFECAKAIDQAPQVKHWFRNISGDRARSFWLPTSSDRFYPDFVAELTDGRIFVIEYKGEPYKTNDDSKEKMNVGARYEALSDGRALFLMAVEVDDKGRDVRQQIAAKIEGRL